MGWFFDSPMKEKEKVFCYGKEIKSFFGTDRICPCSCRKCCRCGKPVAVPISGSKRRRRPVFDRVSGSGTHIWLYPADLRYCHWAQNKRKCHRSLQQNAGKVEIPGNPDLSGTGSDHDLLCSHRRLDYPLCGGLPKRAGRSGSPGRVLHILYHFTGFAGHFRSFIYGRNSVDRL